MDELRNEEMTQEEINELGALTEMEDSGELIVEEDTDSGMTTKLIAGGIAVLGLAAYGTYELGKNVIAPGVKKGVSWMKDHFSKKEDGKVIDAESEFVDDQEDDFEEEVK